MAIVYPNLKSWPRAWVGMALFHFACAGCGKADTGAIKPNKKHEEAAVKKYDGPPLFEDMTARTGIQFSYRNDEEKDYYTILESLGGGVALFDFDGDGLLDLFATGGGYLEGDAKKFDVKGHPSRLYKNLGAWKFQDVTNQVGLDQPLFYTHGCAVADYDRDGWADLLVTGWRRVALYHNQPADAKDPAKGRKFVEVSERAGLAAGGWSTSAAWADLDGDGHVDLYITHYVDWSPTNHPKCHGNTMAIKHEICSPRGFNALAHAIYRNNGNGTFTDVSDKAGLIGRGPGALVGSLSERGKGLAVLLADVNNDGKVDIYVANDSDGNLFYLNKGDFRFEECGLVKGVARDETGTSQGSMGVDAADYDRSGWPSLFVTNFDLELHALYRNLGSKGQFLYSTTLAGLATIGSGWVGWGTRFLDVDSDGWEDLVLANGHVLRHPTFSPFAQQPILFRNQANGRFQNITEQGGSFFQVPRRGRGLAVGDLDNDGRPDLVFTHIREPLAILRNVAGETGKRAHWLGLDLRGKNRRNLVGTKVTVEAGKEKLLRWIKGGGSYLSDHDSRLLIGLGSHDQFDRLTIEWAHGGKESWNGQELTVNRYLQIQEGEKMIRGMP